jgi:hypothetical protein
MFSFFSIFELGETESTWYFGPLFGLLYQPQVIDDDDDDDDDECGAVCGMIIGRGNRSPRRKATPMTLCPPQIPHDLTWSRIRVAAVESRRLTS